MRITKNRMPRPFLKWAGGKTKLLPRILPLFPDRMRLYVEPFLGGGAVFLELVRRGRIERAVLGDRNPELVATWRMVRDATEEVIEALGRWEANNEEVYYQVRSLKPVELEPEVRAARVLWLNRNCFNGLYRLNRKGEFNVPFGRYKHPPRVDAENLRVCGEVLRRLDVQLVDDDFEALFDRAEPGATMYCDPPYWPLSETARFTFYDGIVFGPDDQARLAERFRRLVERDVHGVLSNSSNEHTEALYAGLDVHRVRARRSINRDAKGRGPVEELLVVAQPDPDAGVG